jgi:TP901 family phage tail tape measure protein
LSVGAAVGALAGTAVKMAGDWQASMTKLVTSGGESRDALKMVSDGLLSMSVQVGTSTDQMAKGMYTVESAGFHGAAGLEVLKMAAMGAKAENADLGVVANAVTSALNAYGLGAFSAAMVTNTLVAATANGKMTMQDLAGAISNVLPATSKFHISLIDTTAAIATMTMQGDNASSAATHLRQVILALEAPSKAGASALASIGLTSGEVATEMQTSLPGAIQMITDALGKKFPEGSVAYNEALKNIAGGSKQLLGLLEVSGTSLKAFEQNVKNITAQVKEGGKSIAGWDLIQSNFNFKLDQAKAAVQALFIEMGTHLLPIASKLLDFFTNTAVPGIQKFGDTFGKVVAVLKSPEFTTLANTLNTMLAPALQKAGDALKNIFQPAIDAVSGSNLTDLTTDLRTAAEATNIFLEALQGFQDGSSQFEQAGTSIRDTAFQVWNVMQQIGAFLSQTFEPDWQQLQETINTQIVPAWDDLKNSLGPLMPEFQEISYIAGVVAVASLKLLATVVAGLIGYFIQTFGGIVQIVSGAVQILGGLVAIIVDLFTGNFGHLSTDMQAIWNGIIDIIRGALNTINGITGGSLGQLLKLFGVDLGKINATAQNMDKNVKGSFSDMSTQSLASVQTLSSNAMGILEKLNQEGSGQMQALDQYSIGYWNDLADWIANHPINAVINIDENPINSQGKPFSPTQLKDYRKNAYASGTDYAPGGEALVGEAGMELVVGPRVGYLPRGSRVIPNDQLMHGGSGWGGGGSKQPVHIHVDVGSRELASVLVDDIMDLAARQTRLTHARRVS